MIMDEVHYEKVRKVCVRNGLKMGMRQCFRPFLLRTSFGNTIESKYYLEIQCNMQSHQLLFYYKDLLLHILVLFSNLLFSLVIEDILQAY